MKFLVALKSVGFWQQFSLRDELQTLESVGDIEVNSRLPHDMLVEYEETSITPKAILRELHRCGVHCDIMTC